VQQVHCALRGWIRDLDPILLATVYRRCWPHGRHSDYLAVDA